MAIDILILNKVVGPNVVRIRRRQWHWALTALSSAF
jgi:hypothetical protein